MDEINTVEKKSSMVFLFMLASDLCLTSLQPKLVNYTHIHESLGSSGHNVNRHFVLDWRENKSIFHK
ncbi:MAG TPA: hypothetical protein TECP_00512 [Hyphomicrobiaceae bacterium MAG_BT-2024]